MMERARVAYIEEASELLHELEGSLLELEEDPDNSELIARVFRALHTIKGSGAMFGFDAISSFTHELETVFDGVREGLYQVTPELIGVALDARDHIGELLAAPDSRNGELAVVSSQLLERLRRVVPAGTRGNAENEPAPLEAAARPDEAQTYRIRFDPARDIFLSGTNPIPLLRELTSMGDCSLAAHVERIPMLEDFNPDECYTHWDSVVTTESGENALRDVFIFIEDRARVEVQRISDTGTREGRRLGDILVDRGDMTKQDVEQCLSERPLMGEMLVKAGLLTRDRVRAAVMEQQHLDGVREKRRQAEAATTLRVPATKLDTLVNIVGELVTVQARLTGYASASGESEINFIAEEVERLSALLRESTMSIRMLPIGETFSRFKRLVRDLAGNLSKKVELTTEGNDTELDKTVIEQMTDPLVHLIRNAVDHGIETPDQRLASGKTEIGRIHLSARHTGAFVEIRVSDDGAGMNRDAIRARAVERGMIGTDAVLNDEELFSLTVAPGFSTASCVTAVSGRGVGMDVVQRSLDAVRGSLSISSVAGRGTLVTLKIPLTLAIIDGLLVQAAGAFFVVPLASICECIEMENRGDLRARHSLINVRGEWVPYIALRQRFGLPGDPPPIEQVIVAETRRGKHGFVVDRVIGDHNTVIKKLGNLYRDVEEVSGATVLGDGTVALILDVDKIAAEAHRETDRR